MQSGLKELTAESVSDLADLCVSRSLEKAAESFEAFRTEVEKRVNELYSSDKILSVQINELPSVTLTSRALPVLPRLITNAKLGLYTLLVGPAGCGKTTAAHQLAEALGVQFGSVCLTAGASETWLFGRQTPTGFVEGSFSRLYREGGVFLADEMDAADANLLLSINTALSHSVMLNPMNGEQITKHPQFVFIGAANTNGKGSSHVYTGRARLDAATLDRMVIIKMDYDENLEAELCPSKVLFSFLKLTRRKLAEAKHDEFISTRAFISSFRQAEAGVSAAQIKDSLTANWGEAAKDVAEAVFKEVLVTPSGKKRNAKEVEAEKKFYEKFIRKQETQKWRPVEWKSDDVPF
jgi:cobaltochelatase CobS